MKQILKIKENRKKEKKGENERVKRRNTKYKTINVKRNENKEYK